jgi:hypothetical protein
LHDISTKDTLRNRIAGACFSVALDHFDGVLILLERSPRLYSSTYALIRPIFESYFRGIWFMYCATDKRLKISTRISLINFQRKSSDLLWKWNKPVGFKNNYSMSIQRDWANLCDYSHTGLLQIQRWN